MDGDLNVSVKKRKYFTDIERKQYCIRPIPSQSDL
jgi:hypothetical protein